MNVDDPEAKVTSFYAGKDLGVEVLFDNSPVTHESWRVQTVPTVFVISPENKVLYRGVALWKDIFAAVAAETKLSGKLIPPHDGTEYG